MARSFALNSTSGKNLWILSPRFFHSLFFAITRFSRPGAYEYIVKNPDGVFDNRYCVRTCSPKPKTVRLSREHGVYR